MRLRLSPLQHRTPPKSAQLHPCQYPSQCPNYSYDPLLHPGSSLHHAPARGCLHASLSHPHPQTSPSSNIFPHSIMPPPKVSSSWYTACPSAAASAGAGLRPLAPDSLALAAPAPEGPAAAAAAALVPALRGVGGSELRGVDAAVEGAVAVRLVMEASSCLSTLVRRRVASVGRGRRTTGPAMGKERVRVCAGQVGVQGC